MSAETMANTIKLAEYYLSKEARLVNGASIPPDIAQAEKLRLRLVESWDKLEILPSDILQFGPNSLRDCKAASQAFSIVMKAGWLVPLDPGSEVRDRARREAYRVQKM